MLIQVSVEHLLTSAEDATAHASELGLLCPGTLSFMCLLRSLSSWIPGATAHPSGLSRVLIQVSVEHLLTSAEDATAHASEQTESEGERWKVKLIVFVGGTCGSVHVQTFNNNLKELGVVESKRGAIRKDLVQELLYAQDTVLCSYFAQREGATNGDKGRRSMAAEVFQGLDRFG